jgi:hypothetical protein
MLDVIKEYLVSIGFAINQAQYNKVQSQLGKLDKDVKGDAESMGKAFVKAGSLIVSAITTASIATEKLVEKTVKADLESQKFGRRMMMNTRYAKDFKMSLDAIGESMEDVAFNPELRNQFNQLIGLSRQLRTPGDASGQFKDFRQIIFNFKKMQVEGKYSLEWISYYILKYFNDPLNKLDKTADAFHKKIIKNMPIWSKKAAEFFIRLLNVGLHTGEFVKDLTVSFKKMWDSIPRGVQTAILAIAGFNLFLSASPVGRMIAMLSGLLLLIDDYYGYKEGKKALLADLWGEQPLETMRDGVADLVVGMGRLIEETLKFFGLFDGNTAKGAQGYFKDFQHLIGRLAYTIGKLLSVLGLTMQGKFKEAAHAARQAFYDDYDGWVKARGRDIMSDPNTYQYYKRNPGDLARFPELQEYFDKSPMKGKHSSGLPLNSLNDLISTGDIAGKSWRSKSGVDTKNLTFKTLDALNVLSAWYRKKTGHELTVTSGYRTWQGSSGHNKGIKFDVVDSLLQKNPALRKQFLAYAASLGIKGADEYSNPVSWATGGHLDFNASKFSYLPQGKAGLGAVYNLGGINVNVSGTNATAHEIAEATVGAIHKSTARKNARLIRDGSGVIR